VSPTELIKTTAGELLLLQPGGGFKLTKPAYSEVPTEAGTQIKIAARTMGEAKKMLEGVSRKYPSIDTDALLKSASPSYAYPEGMVHFNFARRRQARAINGPREVQRLMSRKDYGRSDIQTAKI
jgi:hypothetical protein